MQFFFLRLFACVFTLDVSPKAEKRWLCFWSIANSQDFSELFNFPTVFKAGLNIIYSMRCFHRSISQNFSIQWPLGRLIYLSTVVENLHFFFLPLYFFNWRIFALQNFLVFGHISTKISHRYTLLCPFPPEPSISPSIPPFWIIKEPLFAFAESYKFPLAICFTYSVINYKCIIL